MAEFTLSLAPAIQVLKGAEWHQVGRGRGQGDFSAMVESCLEEEEEEEEVVPSRGYAWSAKYRVCFQAGPFADSPAMMG